MSLSISKFFYGLWSNEKKVRISMVGIDTAGKTTILYKLLNGEVVTTIPTIGINIETIHYNNLSLEIWDLGGNDKGRLLAQNHHVPRSDGIILVVDSQDKKRITEVCDEFHHIIYLLKSFNIPFNIPILIYANKQDCYDAMSTNEIVDKLGLQSIKNEWHIQATCAITGIGLYEGLEWLSQKLT